MGGDLWWPRFRAAQARVDAVTGGGGVDDTVNTATGRVSGEIIGRGMGGVSGEITSRGDGGVGRLPVGSLRRPIKTRSYRQWTDAI